MSTLDSGGSSSEKGPALGIQVLGRIGEGAPRFAAPSPLAFGGAVLRLSGLCLKISDGTAT